MRLLGALGWGGRRLRSTHPVRACQLELDPQNQIAIPPLDLTFSSPHEPQRVHQICRRLCCQGARIRSPARVSARESPSRQAPRQPRDRIHYLGAPAGDGNGAELDNVLSEFNTPRGNFRLDAGWSRRWFPVRCVPASASGRTSSTPADSAASCARRQCTGGGGVSSAAGRAPRMTSRDESKRVSMWSATSCVNEGITWL